MTKINVARRPILNSEVPVPSPLHCLRDQAKPPSEWLAAIAADQTLTELRRGGPTRPPIRPRLEAVKNLVVQWPDHYIGIESDFVESRVNRRTIMIRGRVRKGVVVLDDPKSLEDGAEVTVRPIKSKIGTAKTKKKLVTVSQGLLRLAGKAKDLPPDASQNVEHFLYGHTKR